MSRAAKITLAVSTVVSAATVWGVHYMQIQERETMHRGVERDAARQAEKKRQRALDLEMNQERERQYQQMQPTKGWLQSIRGGNSSGDQAGSGPTGSQPQQAPAR